MKYFNFLLLCVISISFTVFSQEKYLYVDIVKVMNNSKTGQSLRKEMEDKFNFYKKQAKDLEKQIQDINEQLKSPLISEQAKKEKQNKIRELQTRLTQLTIEAQETLNKMKSDAEKKLIERIKLVAKEYSLKQDIDIIFTSGMVGAILYANQSIDITQDIIKLLDEEK